MHVEENLQLVQERALERARALYDRTHGEEEGWGVREEDFAAITDEIDRENARRYWVALKTAINTKKFPIGASKGTMAKLLSATPGEVKYGDAVDFFAATTKDRGFFIGSEDMDFSQLEFKYAGASMVGRVFKDANNLSASASGIFGFAGVLTHAAVHESYEDVIEAIEKIIHPIEGVHGPDVASKMTYKLALMTGRYFQKNWKARLPLGIGTVYDYIHRNTALSKELAGRSVWRWDEQTTNTFIEDLFKNRMLTDADRDNLKKELGGRTIQMGFDYMRTVVPLIILLMLWQGTQAALKEDSGGHH